MSLKSMPKELVNLQEAEWIRDMKSHFVKHGTYRAQDLNRLLGDPIKGVAMGSDSLSEKNSLRYQGHYSQ